MMIKEEEFATTVMVSFGISVKLSRLIGNNLVPSTLAIKTDVIQTEETDHAKLSIALTKIKFWFENIVANSIAFSAMNEDIAGVLIDDNGVNRLSNNYLVAPGEPTDDLLATLFQAKMTALASGVLLFDACEVRSDNPVGLTFTLIGNGADLLPDMEEWIGERSFFTEPWWNRDDGSTIDVVPDANADLSIKPEWAFSLDIREKPPVEEAGAIIRHDFKPKVIRGGKKK